MSRLARKIRVALAGLVGGFAMACGSTTPEAPPLAPRPEATPVGAPAPGNPGGNGDGDQAPVPGAPSPIDPAPSDAGLSSVQHVAPATFAGEAHAVIDAGVADGGTADAAVPLPPVPDGGLPPDAGRSVPSR